MLEAPDQVQAAMRYYRQPVMHLESSVLPMPPGARQEVRANARGEFTLTGWTDKTPVRYLWAESEGGALHGIRLVGVDDERVELELGPRAEGSGSLTLDVGPRYQGLPIRWRMNGQPGEAFELPPDETLTFDGLRPGAWKVDARWFAEELLSESGVQVDEAGGEVSLELPDAAINGQDREAWERAGRDWPLL